MGIREAIAAARTRAGHTVSHVASEIGVHETQLARFERGQKGLSVERLQRLMDALDLVVVPRKHVSPPCSDAPRDASAA